jgi:hypothetical protein
MSRQVTLGVQDPGDFAGSALRFNQVEDALDGWSGSVGR